MSLFHQFLGKQTEVQLCGNHTFTGKLIDLGADLMVILHEQRYYYIPLVHVKSLKEGMQLNDVTNIIQEEVIDYQPDSLSLRKILIHAKGKFVELYVAGKKTIHGYIIAIMDDYFIFYSPVYKGMFVSMHHLKWLVPYPPELAPYSLGTASVPVHPVHVALSRTFEEQCKNLEGSLVVFDLGEIECKIGVLEKAEQQMIQLITANGSKVCWNLQHVKVISMP